LGAKEKRQPSNLTSPSESEKNQTESLSAMTQKLEIIHFPWAISGMMIDALPTALLFRIDRYFAGFSYCSNPDKLKQLLPVFDRSFKYVKSLSWKFELPAKHMADPLPALHPVTFP
jgi:hypothetical protein